MFAIFIGSAFAYEAKLAAALYATKLAQHFSWFNLWLESNSSYVVQLFSSHNINVMWKFMLTFAVVFTMFN